MAVRSRRYFTFVHVLVITTLMQMCMIYWYFNTYCSTVVSQRGEAKPAAYHRHVNWLLDDLNRVDRNTSPNMSSSQTCPRLPKYNMTICIHSGRKDKYISRTLDKGNMWEAAQVDTVRRWLLRDTSLTLIDIGANIGIYSLMAAGIGHKALAVEPMPQNFKLLHLSITSVLSIFQH